MKNEIVYVAHPLGREVEANAERTVRWIAYLMAAEPDVTFLCPWLAYVAVFRLRFPGVDDDTGHVFRDRCMRDNLAAARLCSGIVLCGPLVSNGMRQEFDIVVNEARGWCADLTAIRGGHPEDVEPPIDDVAFADRSPLGYGRRRYQAKGYV